MGLITKQIHKRGNQRLAEPMTTTTRLSTSEVVATVRALCEANNQRETVDFQRREQGNAFQRFGTWGQSAEAKHCHVLVQPHQILVGYQRDPEFILARANRRPETGAGYWLAGIRFPTEAPPELASGEQLVEVRLISWVQDPDGKLKNRDKYEAFTDALFDAVSSERVGAG